MRVAGEHEADELSRRMMEEVVGPIGRVTEKGDGFVGDVANGFGDGLVGVGNAFDRIVDPGEPESAAGAFDGPISVVEHHDIVGGERLNYLFTSDFDVVVAENGIALRTFELAEQVCALPFGALCEGVCKVPVRDVVAGENDDVRVEAVDPVDHVADEERLSELVKMDVTQLRDTKTVKCG